MKPRDHDRWPWWVAFVCASALSACLPSTPSGAPADGGDTSDVSATVVSDRTSGDDTGPFAWFTPMVPINAGRDPPDAGATPDGGPTAHRFTWTHEGSPDAHESEVPVAIDSRGTLYIARRHVDAVRRVVRDQELEDSAIVGFDVEGRIAAHVPSTGGLRAMPHGLVADDTGFYALVAYNGDVDLTGLRLSAPEPSGTTALGVIGFDRAGAVRWGRPLGVARWGGRSLLSRRYDGRLVVVGTPYGTVTAGTRTVGSATSQRLVRIDLALTSGDVLDAWDLADGGQGPLQADLNARGELLASVYETTLASSAFYGRVARVRLFSADGALGWEHVIPESVVALDDEGQSYLAAPNLCGVWASRLAERGLCVASIDELGRGRWIANFMYSGFEGLYQRLAWRGAALDVFAQGWWRSEWTGTSGLRRPQCSGWYRSRLDARLDADGANLDLSYSYDAAFGRFVGGGRRCALTLEWPETGCGNVPTRLARGTVTCARATDPACPPATRPCGANCVAMDSDPDHCGACGRRCAGAFPNAAGYCNAGVCTYGVCEHGRASCDGDPHNGCEVDLAQDPLHCGLCGNVCSAGTTCDGGQCCAAGRCTHALASDGHEGAFAPTSDVTLTPGVHQYTTITVPAAVTVRTAPGATLDLRATGDVRVDGAIDLSGRDGACCGTTGCASFAPEGPFPGADGSESSSGWCETPSFGRSPLPSTFMPPEYTSPGRAIYGGSCGGHNDTPPGSVVRLGATADSGTIGVEAFEDLAVNRVFTPGSRGGTFSGPTARDRCTSSSGGGGGGALRVVSAARVELGATGRLLARGGASGGSGSGGGSGGVVAVYAPEVRVPAGATLDASGTTPGRVRVSVDPSRCDLAGTVLPALVNGCNPTPPERAPAHAFVSRWPL